MGLDRGADDAAMRRAGALELVSMGWVRLESLLGRYVPRENDEAPEGRDRDSDAGPAAQTTPSLGKGRALQISLQYENTECAALLLPGTNSSLRPEDFVSSTQEQTPTSDVSSNSRNSKINGSGDEFLNLPLLLLRMPAPLKTVVIDFISRSFDCRISSLSLGTQSLVGALERWMGDSRIPTKGPLAKDIVLTLGFYGPTVLRDQKGRRAVAEENSAEENDGDSQKQTTTVGVKAIDLIVPNPELRRFFRAGELSQSKRHSKLDQSRYGRQGADDLQDHFGYAKRRKMGGDKDEESWTWRRWETSPSRTATKEGSRSQPFTEALAEYVREHLALDIFHPAVRVTKIACGGFVLSEGRVKVFGIPPNDNGEDGMSDRDQRAVWSVVDTLLDRAQVKPLEKTLSSIAV